LAATLIARTGRTRLLKVFDVVANVNAQHSFSAALVDVDRELNLLDNASRGDSLGVIPSIIFRAARTSAIAALRKTLVVLHMLRAGSSESARSS
jgi:hypothetical protein